jgi:hypothetical protein
MVKCCQPTPAIARVPVALLLLVPTVCPVLCLALLAQDLKPTALLAPATNTFMEHPASPLVHLAPSRAVTTVFLVIRPALLALAPLLHAHHVLAVYSCTATHVYLRVHQART